MINNGEKIIGYQEVLVYGKFQSGSEFLGIRGGYALFKRYELEFGGTQTKWKKIGFGIRSKKNNLKLKYLNKDYLELRNLIG